MKIGWQLAWIQYKARVEGSQEHGRTFNSNLLREADLATREVFSSINPWFS